MFRHPPKCIEVEAAGTPRKFGGAEDRVAQFAHPVQAAISAALGGNG